MTHIDNKLLEEVLDNESSSAAQVQKSTMNLSTVNIFGPSHSSNKIKSSVKHKKNGIKPLF